MTERVRLTVEERKAIILSAALKVARLKGLDQVTYQNVAEACASPTTAATVRYYVGPNRAIRQLVVKRVLESREPGYALVIERGRELGLIN